MDPINVLSLFDGMSCGQIALQRANIAINTYYASEIDKYAQIVSKANYPNTVYLGDVRSVNVNELKHIDLLIGGSPCQSFSFGGKKKGMSTKCEIEILTLTHYLELKSQNFEFEGQSYLFWEYMRVLNEIRKINPQVNFLLENVQMSDKWRKVLTQAIGIRPIEINSTLVSAQNRERLYWTNIFTETEPMFGDEVCIIPQPKDKGILLKHILQPVVAEKYFMSDKMMNYFNNRAANFNNGKINIRNEEGKASTIIASSKSIDISDNFVEIITVVNDNGTLRTITKGMCLDANYYKGMDNHAQRSMVIHNYCSKKNLDQIKLNRAGDFSINQDKASSLAIGGHGAGNHSDMDLIAYNEKETRSPKIRRLTPTECERLQTVPDNFTNHVSDTQRYKMLGNGWTVDVITHIFSYLNKNSPLNKVIYEKT